MTYVGRLWAKGERVSVWGHHIVPNGTRGVIFDTLLPTMPEPPEDYEPEYQVLIPGHYQDREEPMAWVMEQKRVRELARGSGSEVHWPLESRYLFEEDFEQPQVEPESNVVRLPTGVSVAGMTVGEVDMPGAKFVNADPAMLAIKRALDSVSLAMCMLAAAETAEDAQTVYELLSAVRDHEMVDAANAVLARFAG